MTFNDIRTGRDRDLLIPESEYLYGLWNVGNIVKNSALLHKFQ